PRRCSYSCGLDCFLWEAPPRGRMGGWCPCRLRFARSGPASRRCSYSCGLDVCLFFLGAPAPGAKGVSSAGATPRPSHLRTVEERGQHLLQIFHILHPRQLADRVHGEGRRSYVDGTHTQTTGGDGPYGAAAAHVAAHHEGLHRYLGLLAQMAEQGRGFAGGGVALVVVDLDHRTGIELRAVIAVMTVGIVGVDAMGVVR